MNPSSYESLVLGLSILCGILSLILLLAITFLRMVLNSHADEEDEDEESFKGF